MSYFEDYERKLEEEDAEQAEIDASNEYQKELDENQIHIEKLADGSWVGSQKTENYLNEDEKDELAQNLLDRIEEVRTKDITSKSIYKLQIFMEEVIDVGYTWYVLLKKIGESNE